MEQKENKQEEWIKIINKLKEKKEKSKAPPSKSNDANKNSSDG